MNIPLSVPGGETYLQEHSMMPIFQLPILSSLDMSQHSHHTKSVCVILREELLKFQTKVCRQIYYQEVMSRKYKLASSFMF